MRDSVVTVLKWVRILGVLLSVALATGTAVHASQATAMDLHAALAAGDAPAMPCCDGCDDSGDPSAGCSAACTVQLLGLLPKAAVSPAAGAIAAETGPTSILAGRTGPPDLHPPKPPAKG